MKNIELGSTDTGVLFWRLENAFANDPLIQMLSKNVREGIARAFHDASVREGKISLNPYSANVTVVMRNILRVAPLGWVGDDFKDHVVAVSIAALLPESIDAR